MDHTDSVEVDTKQVSSYQEAVQLEEMSLWEHIEALRFVLAKSLATVAVLTGVFFYFMPEIFDAVILAPCRGDFFLYQIFELITRKISFVAPFSTSGFGVKLINIELASQFFTHMSTAFYLGLIFSLPVVLYWVWTFVRPALYPQERALGRWAFALGMVLFIIGLGVGYAIVFPVTLRFLAGYQISTAIVNQISLSSYIDTFLMLVLVMGLVFELPLLCWILSAMGLIRRKFFRTYRRHAIVVLLILAAVITPTGDPFTLSIVFLPIYMLYEFSALLVRK